MPGWYFEMIGQLNFALPVHIIQLKEISPPITFVKPPFFQSPNSNSSSFIQQWNIVSPPASNYDQTKPTSKMLFQTPHHRNQMSMCRSNWHQSKMKFCRDRFIILRFSPVKQFQSIDLSKTELFPTFLYLLYFLFDCITV